MSEDQAKGDVFLRVLDQVMARWGTRGLKDIGAYPDDYKEEQWYPFEDLCGLLRDVKASLGNNNPLSLYDIGFKTIKGDPRWHGIFQDRDPAEIFTSTKRQEAQYRVGTQSLERVGEKHVRVIMDGWACDDVWYDFFRGRLQGVLELTGRTGVVHLQRERGEDGSRVYDIKWG